MKCNCQDWKENIEKVNAPLMLAAARSGFAPHANYQGKQFVFCPWCSTRLIEQGSGVHASQSVTDDDPKPKEPVVATADSVREQGRSIGQQCSQPSTAPVKQKS